ncbi:MAG: gamma-glutamyltransferase [Pseudomonadales bacterium]|jgi:gamma-glutamyltranspeptidase/glutathione hydrolase|nr:gamma-glutamyltransferase [Pseudomonadales bacterium]MDP6471932.1 gamma-glutamyltransferase [Pseudomonadales bacterium]MDP6826798.1 gamma-glutamyltransferase [Pseudomonadales bacterium]MDP6970924.1 gamma-glutamyltransferase [Pseudomonadales bacterium]
MPRIIVLIATLCCALDLSAAQREPRHGDDGIVATRSYFASVVGASILRGGGNAVDAAVAAGFALAVTHPSAGNLGGGGFMVIRMADGTAITNDHREKAPAAASRDMYLDDEGEVVEGLSTRSHLAVGVPGTVAGLLDALEKYGTMSRKEVIQPAIVLARNGFVLPRDLALAFERRKDQFARYPASAEVFTNEGEPYTAGELFVQHDLARTLERIRRRGRDGFYKGKTADLLVAEMERGGGLITHQDLEDYMSVWREPLRGTYRGHEIVSMPPPSSGGALLIQMLNMIEPYDVSTMGFGSADTIHLMIEAERRAYADRAEHLGDPDFYPVPMARLTDKDYARSRFEDFDPNKASLSSDIGPGTTPVKESPDTTHMSVIDGEGNAVAYTTTLNLSYGSKIVAAGTGMLLNNEMDDFSSKDNTPNAFGLLGREANAIAPGKRMLSSMTPTIVVKDGEPMLVTGSPGGSTIITTTLQVIVNVIDHDMDVSQAVGAPRFHHQWQPNRIIYEPFGISPDTLTGLRERGHTEWVLMPFGRGIGDANSVMRTGDGLKGASDPRNAGAAVGYTSDRGRRASR